MRSKIRKIQLNLAAYFNGPAIQLQLGVIDCLTGHLLDCAFDFCRRFGDSVLVDDFFLQDLAKQTWAKMWFSFPLVSKRT
jgi:hypothetical protein